MAFLPAAAVFGDLIVLHIQAEEKRLKYYNSV